MYSFNFKSSLFRVELAKCVFTSRLHACAKHPSRYIKDTSGNCHDTGSALPHWFWRSRTHIPCRTMVRKFQLSTKSTLRASLCGSPSGVHRPCPRHHTCTVRCSIHTPYQECAISSNRCVTAKQEKVRNWHPSWREMLCKESGWRSCYSRD